MCRCVRVLFAPRTKSGRDSLNVDKSSHGRSVQYHIVIDLDPQNLSKIMDQDSVPCKSRYFLPHLFFHRGSSLKEIGTYLLHVISIYHNMFSKA